jgi:hypothetical protein
MIRSATKIEKDAYLTYRQSIGVERLLPTLKILVDDNVKYCYWGDKGYLKGDRILSQDYVDRLLRKWDNGDLREMIP